MEQHFDRRWSSYIPVGGHGDTGAGLGKRYSCLCSASAVETFGAERISSESETGGGRR